MNLGEINDWLDRIVQDASLSSYFTEWVNIAVSGIANDFFLPALKLKEPEDLVITESDWLYDMPSNYMKKLFKAYDSNYDKITIRRSLDDIDYIDIDHDDTGSNVTDIAVRDDKAGVYPMADETIKIWFYENPTALAEDSDDLECIPSEYHYRVVIPRVVIENYQLLMDMSVNPPHQSLEWWKEKYRVGLFGEARGEIGMINCFARERKPKRSGGKNPLP